MAKNTVRARLAKVLTAVGFYRCDALKQWDVYTHDHNPGHFLFLGVKGQFRAGEKVTRSTNFSFWRDRLLAGTHTVRVNDGAIAFLKVNQETANVQ